MARVECNNVSMEFCLIILMRCNPIGIVGLRRFDSGCICCMEAEGVGFEPTDRRNLSTVFKTVPINHSGTPPRIEVGRLQVTYGIWHMTYDRS